MARALFCNIEITSNISHSNKDALLKQHMGCRSQISALSSLVRSKHARP
jgi:hypothetical protein